MPVLTKMQLDKIKFKMDAISESLNTVMCEKEQLALDNEYWDLHEQYNRTYDLFYQAENR